MGLFSRFATLLHHLFCLFTLLAYALCYWSISSHWIAGFIMMSLPVLVLGHLLVVGLSLISRQKTGLFKSTFVILLSFPFWSRTYQGGRENENEAAGGFRILSYNVHNFGLFSKDNKEQSLLSEAGLKWLKTKDPDLICFQEAYIAPGKQYDPVSAMGSLGYKHYAFFNNNVNQKPAKAEGLAFFSRYKLKALDQENFGGQNGIFKADVLIGEDTLTVINVHLQSMTLDLPQLSKQREVEGLKTESKKTFFRMREGFRRRNKEVEKLEEWIKQSRHPVIVCGDFNDTPYSYSYGRLLRILQNSFESGGKGFGFTFRNMPYFIRIDNQFYDSGKIGLINFETSQEAYFSDHRPLICDYQLFNTPD